MNLFKKLREKGNTLVLFAIAIPVAVGATGLVLDWGRGVWTRTELQRAADAGALSGCSFMKDSQTMADYQAFKSVQANFDGPDGATYTADAAQETYTVQLNETVPTLFMRIFGRENMEVGVSATALGPQPIGGLRGGGFPFAIINPDLNSSPCDDLVPSNWGRPYIIGYGENNVIVADWANDCGAVPPNPGNGVGNGNGWRGALGLNQDGTYHEGGGGSDLKENMINGWPGEMKLDDVVPTETGNISGPITQGRDALLGSEPLPWGEFDIDTDTLESRVVLVPIVHLINTSRNDTFTVQDWNNGADWDQSEVVVDGWAPFFILTTSEQGDVDGDGNANDPDWIVGLYIPGVEINNYLPPEENQSTEEWGVYSTSRLID
jgi:hypothetical protein